MNQNVRLGRIAGIPVGVNWSIVVIFFLLAWELADLVLPGDQVSHAVVAKRNGIGVRRITLWLFGGVSELDKDALTPGADFRIAIAGPVTSFVLAGVYGVFGILLHDAGGAAGVIGSALGWLAWINLLLGGFNLMPAAPLDGGRVLRAALWRRSGDRVGAATAAAKAGEVFAYILVGLGVLEFLAVGVIGLWFVFLGWFLLSAARAEQNAVVMRSSLADVHVRDLMTKEPTTFSSATTVAELIDHQLGHHRFSSYPLVGSDGQLEGLTTIGRLRHVPGHLRQTTRLIDTAAPLSEVPVADPGEPVPDLLQRMQASPDGRALVIDGNHRFVGIVSPSDIARFMQLSMLQAQGRGERST